MAVDPKIINNCPGTLTSCGWMDVPRTEFFPVLAVGIFISWGLSVSDETNSGRGWYQVLIWKTQFELLLSPSSL